MGILDKVRAAMPDASITTDIIVGFPVRPRRTSPRRCAWSSWRGLRARISSSTARDRAPLRSTSSRFPRPSCRSASSDCTRSRRRSRCVTRWRWRDVSVELLVLDGEGRKGKGDRMSGREPGNRLVHFSVPEGADVPRPGDMVTVRISHGAPHHLIADPGGGGPVRSAPHARGRRVGEAPQAEGPRSTLAEPLALAVRSVSACRDCGSPRRDAADCRGRRGHRNRQVRGEPGVAHLIEGGGEIVNADSMQFYQGMDIGTAKLPSARSARSTAPPARHAQRGRGRIGRAFPGVRARGHRRDSRAGPQGHRGRRLGAVPARAA